jgi:hypothetical protein
MSFAATRAIDELHPDLPGWTEQLAIGMAAAGIMDDIRIDRDDRVVVAPDAAEPPSVRWAKLLIVLAAAVALGAAGLVGAKSFLRPADVSSPPPRAIAPAATTNAGEASRLKVHPTVVRKADRAATATIPAVASQRTPARIAHAKPPRAVSPAPSTTSIASNYVPPAPAPAAERPSPEPRLTTPVPETRPTTVDGWVLRDIVNGTAVLEGPDGIVRVRRGDSVPGLGQVEEIFGWGNRMIVSTSRGLISTP